MLRTWFFPDDYLADIEQLIRIRLTAEGKAQPKTLPAADVLVMAQAVGLWAQKLIERYGSVDAWLKQWQNGPARGVDVEHLAETFAEVLRGQHLTNAQPSEPTTKPGAIPQTWARIQDLYNEKKPATWPAMSRRLKLGQMATRLEEGIAHAGSIAEFLSLFESALLKVPEFYRGEYVNKGGRKRPATDCLLCLLSADKNHKELGVGGWRMFEWADLIEAGQANSQAAWRHPAEEFCKWTGTAWTHRGPFFALSEVEQQQKKRELIEAGYAPADS